MLLLNLPFDFPPNVALRALAFLFELLISGDKDMQPKLERKSPFSLNFYVRKPIRVYQSASSGKTLEKMLKEVSISPEVI